MLSPIIRKRLEAQGFVYSYAPSFVRIEPWLRFSPAAYTVLIGLSTRAGIGTLAMGAHGHCCPRFSPLGSEYRLENDL